MTVLCSGLTLVIWCQS